MSQFPVEPWNTFSNIIFLFIAVYWWRKIHGRYSEHPLMSIALPILLVGFVGGTIYHATRTNVIWLILDFVPIFALGILASYHFWRRLGCNVLISVLFVFLPLIIPRGVTHLFGVSQNLRIPIGYATLALAILLPIALYCRSQRWKQVHLIGLAVVSFGIALTFRTIDFSLGAKWFPMGTHFLWHLFGGVSTFFLFQYIYNTSEASISLATDELRGKESEG